MQVRLLLSASFWRCILKLREQLTNAYRAYRTCSKLYNANWRDYRSLYVISGVITVTVILSVIRFLAYFLLDLGGIPYLSASTLPQIEKSAWVLIPLALLLFFLFYVAYFQYSVILIGARDIRNDEYRLFRTLLKAFKSTVHASPFTILLVAFNMCLVLPVVGVIMFPTDLFSNVTIPDWVFSLMSSRWYLFALLIAGILALYWLALRYYLVLPLTILKGHSVSGSFSISASMMKGHKWKTFVQLLVISLLFLAGELLVFLPVSWIQQLADRFGDPAASVICIVLLTFLKVFVAYYSIRISIILFFLTYPEDMFVETKPAETANSRKERKLFNRILGILSAVCMIAFSALYSTWFILSYQNNEPLVISNAGIDGENGIPNTISAMLDTVSKANPDFVSATVQPTKDGRFVVIGVDDLFRYCGATGAVRDMTLEEIISLPASYKNYRDHYSPLELYLAAAAAAKQPLILELTGFTVSPDTVERFLEQYGDEILSGGHILQSSDYAVVERILEINEDRITATGTYASAFPVSCSLYNSLIYPALETYCLSVDDSNLQQMFINRGKLYHQQILVWEVNTAPAMDRMILMNVDGIYTSYPSLLKKRIKALQNSGYSAVIKKFIYMLK